MIYLDNNATTAPAAAVRETVFYCMEEYYANSASLNHFEGIKANTYLEECRAVVAQMIEAAPENLFFNSGATEANNMVIKSVADSFSQRGKVHIITSAIEHKCLLKSCEYLEKRGCEVTYLPVDFQGVIRIDRLIAAIRPETRLISIMAANNETGALQPLREIGEIARQHGILFHTDAAQFVGKLPFSVREYQPDFVSFSAHKFYGPKGIGALYCSKPELLLGSPLIHGGGQEWGVRSGTVNLPGVAGMAKAAELFISNHVAVLARHRDMKQKAIEQLLSQFPDASINGCRDKSLPNTINFSLPGIKASTLLKKLKMKVALSSASACHSAEQKFSHVLTAMGLSEMSLESAIRLSFSNTTNADELGHALELITSTAHRLRGTS
ncbi:cysteine desulfurase [bacteria symbiont BFo1 of Frankliniella occidentalis]|jgi:cysteine desulfurase|uniref:Cysteine desulfurase family protein n=1 Tax=Erwinia aphidicola TaxID=68334 RepID=A0ABU8DD83_ERWAP|nr:cysteine desulfurase family protein [Erwinia aphidicola]KMV67142.1 cysteine desulfurase [bacteria symbiont BFo1 of Frankliniella occidentalis]PIJ56611.1 cysteine desulfurase [Erwinia sp. OLMDLW33]KYP82965.1 cysteine desulfurase [bacteria symbiont BFo1 of Frankliniella occidentalis]KYP87841.1 cysteine desulfurase [bacteria symbiont BFo1 of Frankliniella occidentalis]MBD1377709.1 cysteine desulfurase [Erwinia aphidicola]